MARPRKNQGTPQAHERIKQAFWALLEEHDLKQITVSMVVAQAHCNRGTFYYHFDSLDALLDQIIEDELTGPHGLPHDLFLLASGTGAEALHAPMARRLRQAGLMLERVGIERMLPKIRAVFLDMWKTVLCDGDDCLATETRLVLEFSLSGTIGLIDYLYREDLVDEDGFTPATYGLIGENSRHTAMLVCRAQGISAGELTTRLHLFTQMIERD